MTSMKPLFFLLLFGCSLSFSAAQEDDAYKVYFKEIESIVRANSSRSLADHLFDKVEIKMDGRRKEYSKSQAEAVIKQFFQDNSANNFDFVHDGKNRTGGIVYAIGDYITNSSNYRLVMRAQKFQSSYKLYRIEFTKQR